MGFLEYSLKQDFSRLWLVNTWLLAVPLMLLFRAAARLALRAGGCWVIPALLASEPGLGYRVAAQMPFSALEREWGWSKACRRHRAGMVILAADEADLRTHGDHVSRLSCERLSFVCLQTLAGLPVVSLEAHHLIGRDVLLLIQRGWS